QSAVVNFFGILREEKRADEIAIKRSHFEKTFCFHAGIRVWRNWIIFGSGVASISLNGRTSRQLIANLFESLAPTVDSVTVNVFSAAPSQPRTRSGFCSAA